MKKVVGIWDMTRTSGSLGLLLILLEELQIQCRMHGADTAEVILVGDVRYLVDGGLESGHGARDGWGLTNADRLSSSLAVLGAMAGVSACHVCNDSQAVAHAAALIRTDCIVWPDLGRLARGDHTHDSTQLIQAFFARTGSIPRLTVTPERLARAKRYLRDRSGAQLCVAVHLKHNRNAPGQSNADLEEWQAFFSACEGNYSAHFVLIGDDATDGKFDRLRNVTIARDDGLHVEDYIALIQAADLFMGMMSGPANMALFGTTPYVIFKNPDHHATEMAAEIGDADRYPFALENQRVLRQWDTAASLGSAFERATANRVAS